MDQTLTVNGVEAMAKNKYSRKEWLNYYRNSWNRNIVALTIDVQDDIARASKNEKDEVYYLHPDVQQLEAMPVVKRLEHRKADLERALATFAAIEALVEEDEITFNARHSEEALAPKKEEVPSVTPEIVAPQETPTENPAI